MSLGYKTLREEVVLYLRRQILNGVIRPGEKINEMEVSRELNISRGPVREALRQIEQEGLVDYSPNRGCTVKTISLETMTEVYLIRSTLETLAVKVYSGKMRQEAIETLRALAATLGDLAEKNDLSGIVQADEEFHETIVKEAGVHTLLETWKQFEGQNAAVYYTMQKSDLLPSKVLEDNHLKIVKAFEDQDLTNIVKILEKHYMVVPEDLFKKQNRDSQDDKILSLYK